VASADVLYTQKVGKQD